jgi:long-chain acyl-CoA synthetase
LAYAYQTEKSLSGLFFAQAAKYKDDVFLRSKLQRGLPCDEWIEMRWGDVAREVRHMGAGLIELGVKKNDRVGIFAHNRPRWIISDQAIQGAGGIGVPIYPTSTDDQLAFILNDCKAKGVIAGDAQLMEQAVRVKSRVPSLEFIACMAPVKDRPDPCVIDYDELQDKGTSSGKAREEFEKRRKALTEEDIAAIIYTSGTTGEPKGVMLDQSNFKAQTDILLSPPTSQKLLERGIRLNSLCHLPLSHIMGRANDYHAQVALGNFMTFAESYQKVSENLLEVRPQMLISIPRLYEKILEAVQIASDKMKGRKKKIFDWALKVGDEASDYMIRGEKMPGSTSFKFSVASILVYEKIKKVIGLDRLVMAGSGGGALSKEVNKFFRSMNVVISEGYGLTETTSAVTWNGPDFIEPLPDNWIYNKAMDWLIDTLVVTQGKGKNPFKSPVGTLKLMFVSNLLLPRIVIKPGTVGRPCKQTEIRIEADGEILVKGPQVFKRENGYFNRPDLTDEVFTEDGFFMTGDIGEFDEDGFLKITDRKKELLVTSGGKNIAPHPIELALTNDPYIDQACAVGDSKKFVAALIVPQFELLEKWAKENAIEFESVQKLIEQPEVIELYDTKVRKVNENLARYEQIKTFRLLNAAFSEETGELTPTLKMKRRIINEKFSKEIELLYKK